VPDNEILKEMLRGLGFRKEDRSSGSWWVIENRDLNNAVLASGRKSQNVWYIKKIELYEKKKTIQLNRIEISLNHMNLIENLKANAHLYFYQNILSEFRDLGQGVTACFFEVFRGKSRKERDENRKNALKCPASSFGFKFQMSLVNERIHVYLYDHFLLGEFPGNVVSQIIKYIVSSLEIRIQYEQNHDSDSEEKKLVNLPSVKYMSIQEISFPAIAPLLLGGENYSYHLQKGQNLPFDLLLQKNLIVNSTHHFRDGKHIFEVVSQRENLKMQSAVLGKVPVEILESHEKSQELLKNDILIISGRCQKYLDKVKQIQHQNLDPFLLKRYSIIVLEGQTIPSSIAEAIISQKDSNDSIVMSAAIRIAQSTGNYRVGLYFLSRLGHKLASEISDIENIRSMEVAFTEFLGDFWACEDPAKAYLSYQRIGQKRGDHPRILRKMASVAAKIPDNKLQYECLTLLISIERRHYLLAEAFYDLSILVRTAIDLNIDRENDPLKFALKALQYQKSDMKYVLLVVDLLSAQGAYEQAIQLLDQIIQDKSLSIAPVDRAKLEHAVGDIWQNGLDRPDLAQWRYEQSLQHLGSNVQLLASLASIYRQQGEHKKLVAILEKILDSGIVGRDLETLRESFDELIDIYVSKVNDHRTAFKTFEKMSHFNEIVIEELKLIKSGKRPDYIETIAKSDAKIVKAICDELQQRVKDIKLPEKRSDLRCRIAEILRDKLSDSVTASDLLVEAAQESKIDEDNIKFLVNFLEKNLFFKKLYQVLESSLKYEDDEKKQVFILKKLFFLPEALSDERRDEIMLHLLENMATPDHEDSLVMFEQRVQHYRNRAELKGLLNIVYNVKNSLKIRAEEKIELITFIKESLKEIDSKASIHTFEQVVSCLLSLGEPEHVLITEILDYMFKRKDKERFIKYFDRSIELGIVPLFDKENVFKLLRQNEDMLFQYHWLMATHSRESSVILNHAKEALSLVRGSVKAEQDKVEPILGILGRQEKITQKEFEIYEQFCIKKSLWADLVNVLKKQIELERDPNFRFVLLNKYADLQLEQMSDIDGAISTLQEVLRIEINPQRTLTKLASLSNQKGDQTLEGRFLCDILGDDRILLQRNELKNVVERLVKINYRVNFVEDKLLSYAALLSRKKLIQEALGLCKLLESNGIINEKVLATMFLLALDDKNTEMIADSWVQNITYFGKDVACEKFRQFAILEINSRKLRHVLASCYKNLFSLISFGKINDEAYYESLIDYASILFNDNINREKALILYDEAFKLRPDDFRIWIPHYMLLTEFGDEEVRINQLRYIIPKIETNKRVISKYPVTVESLKVQLKKLEKNDEKEAFDEVKNTLQKVSSDSIDSSHELVGADSGLHAVFGTKGDGDVYTFSNKIGDLIDNQNEPKVSMVSKFEEKSKLSIVKEVDSGKKQDEAQLKIPILEGSQPQFTVKDPPSFKLVRPEPDGGEGLVSKDTRSDQEFSAVLKSPFQIDQKTGNKTGTLSETSVVVPTFSLLEDPRDEQALSGPNPEGGNQGSFPEKIPIPPNVKDQAKDVQKVNLSDQDPSGKEKFVAEGNASGGDDLDPPNQIDRSSHAIENNDKNAIKVTEAKVEVQQQEQVEQDWRKILKYVEFTGREFQDFLKASYLSDIDRHVGYQVTALISGDLRLLMENWRARVWRDPSSFFYDLSSKDRVMDSFLGHNSDELKPLHGILFSYLQYISPILVRAYQERFTVDFLGRLAKIRTQQIAKSERLLDWNQGFLQKVGLHLYSERFKQRQISIYDLKGLNQLIFYEGKERKIYLDIGFYKVLPPSILFHRILNLLWEIRLNYVVLLSLEPKTYVAPILNYIGRKVQDQSTTRIGKMLKTDRSLLSDSLTRLDMRKLEDYVTKVKIIQDSDLYGLWRAMRLYVRCLDILETLDIVGSFESIMGRDLIQKPMKPGEVFSLFGDAKFLLDLTTKINI
jgi:tetratricopeptide (TPR) repeat protein